MTSNPARAETLERALRAGMARDHETIAALCTDDVKTWTPAASSSSLASLLDRLERLDDAFSEIELDVHPLDVGGEFACAEWSVAMTHTGPLAVAGGGVIGPSGVRVVVNGVTVCEFHGDRICSLRQYWDEVAVMEQLGMLPAC